MSRLLPALVLLVGSLAAAAPPVAPAPTPVGPKFVDDDTVYDGFFDKLEALAGDKKPLAHKKLLAKMQSRRADVAPAKPGTKALTPEEVYKVAERSVFIVGSLYPHKDGFWEVGTYATAWVVAPDGVLATNWHVFTDLEDGELFGAADRDGNVYPLTDFLGGDKTADVAFFRIAAKGLKPLPVATEFAEIGSWVGLISHPGDLFYIYTQGTVTRYSTNENDEKKRERWLETTAEYASGSSGAPVLNKYGAVVGMACMTLGIEDEPLVSRNPNRGKKSIRNPARLSRADQPKDGKKDDKKDDKPKPPEKPEPPKVAPLQMVVKMTVPSPELLKWLK